MKKLITYCSFAVSGLIFIIAICLFLVKLDLIKYCYFSNDGGTSFLIVDKKVNQFIENDKYKNCKLSIDENWYKAHLTFNEKTNNGYQYWLSINQNSDLPIIENLVKCNFGGEMLVKHLF